MHRATPELASFLESDIKPIQEECDRDFSTLNRALNRMGQAGLFALVAKGEIAGKPLSKATRYGNKTIETFYSGALSFLNSQINLSTAFLNNGTNDALKKEWLPKIFHGETKIGNAVAHLRNKQDVVVAKEIAAGYEITGHFDWLTGYGHFDHFVLGFRHGGKEHFALVPFENRQDAGTIHLGPVKTVLCMQATQTVKVTFNQWRIPFEFIIDSQVEGSWDVLMKANPHILPYFQGIALSALEILNERAPGNEISDKFKRSLDELREAVIANGQPDFIALRAQLTQLTWQCLQCAVTVSKGEAMNPHSRISRLYREIVQFNALASIPEFVSAFFDQIILGPT